GSKKAIPLRRAIRLGVSREEEAAHRHRGRRARVRNLCSWTPFPIRRPASGSCGTLAGSRFLIAWFWAWICQAVGLRGKSGFTGFLGDLVWPLPRGDSAFYRITKQVSRSGPADHRHFHGRWA